MTPGKQLHASDSLSGVNPIPMVLDEPERPPLEELEVIWIHRGSRKPSQTKLEQ
jgi:hypothetical protein